MSSSGETFANFGGYDSECDTDIEADHDAWGVE